MQAPQRTILLLLALALLALLLLLLVLLPLMPLSVICLLAGQASPLRAILFLGLLLLGHLIIGTLFSIDVLPRLLQHRQQEGLELLWRAQLPQLLHQGGIAAVAGAGQVERCASPRMHCARIGKRLSAPDAVNVCCHRCRLSPQRNTVAHSGVTYLNMAVGAGIETIVKGLRQPGAGPKSGKVRLTAAYVMSPFV